MKKSCDEELATHVDLDPYADDGNVVGVASARGTVRLGILSSEIPIFVRRPCPVKGKTTRLVASWRATKRHGGVVEPKHDWLIYQHKLQTREPGDPIGFRIDTWRVTSMWNDQRTSQAVLLI